MRAIARCEEIIADSGRDPLTEAVAANALSLPQRHGRPLWRGARAQRAEPGILEDLGLALMLPTLDGWTGQAELLAGDPLPPSVSGGARTRLWRGSARKGTCRPSPPTSPRPCTEQGRFDEAEELTAASESMTFPDDVTSQISWRTVRAKVAARKGNLDLAETLASDAVARAAATDWPHLRGGALEAMAEVQLAKGQTDAAAATAREALGLYEAKGSVAAADALRARFDT